MGLFINTLPVRIRVGGEGAEESVRRMHVQLANCCVMSTPRWRWRSDAAGARSGAVVHGVVELPA